ncbi:MAG: hypothetical protein DRH97_04040, partial [Chloroflexi bacterium]
MNKKKKNIYKAIIAIAVALVFVLPGSAAFANVGTIGITPDIEKTSDIKDIEDVITSDNSDSSDTEDTELPNIKETGKETDDHNLEEPCLDCEPEREPRIKEHRVPVAPLKVKSTNNILTRGTIYVDDDADPSWYNETHVKTIQEGVNNASAGWTVYVYNGTYPECVYVDKQLDLVGESKSDVVVDGEYNGDTFYVDANDISFDAFTIQNGLGGITFDSVSGCTVTNCIVNDSEYDGIWLYKCSDITITKSEFYYNGWEGIDLWPAYNCVISDCYTYGNGDGLCMYSDEGVYCDNNIVTNCNFDSTWWSGAWFSEASNNIFTNCTFDNNYEGLYIQSDSNNNLFSNCSFRDNLDYGLDICFDSFNNTFEDCTISGTIGGGYQPEHWYGIWISSGDYTSFINCDIYDNTLYGFIIKKCPHLRLRNTNIYNNGYNFGFDFIYNPPDDLYLDIDDSNTVEGKLMYWLDGVNSYEINETHDPGYVGLINCTNVIIKNVNVSAILMVYTNHSTISNAIVHNNRRGIFLYGCEYIDVVDTLGYDNANGLVAEYSPYTNITNCVFHDNAMINCYMGKGIYLKYSPYCNVVDTIAYNNGYEGIEAGWGSDYTNIVNCVSYNNYGECHPGGPWFGRGFNIYFGTHYCTVRDCTTYDNYESGIIIRNGNYNNVINCVSYDNLGFGIWLRSGDSNNNNIAGCVFYNNSESGINLYYALNNNFINCDSYNNTYGIYISDSSNNNLIYHNNFVDNDYNAYDSCTNTWDNGYPSGGNHWSDYTGVDTDGDGIGDTPYNISGGSNQDNYPLMNPHTTPELISPENGYGTPDQTPTFDWTDSGHTLVTYTLQVATDPGFTDPSMVINQTGIEESEYTPTTMAYDTYYWRVRAKLGPVYSEWSETWSFFIAEDVIPPTTPDLLSPDDNSTIANPGVYFDWTDAYDAYGIDYYTLQVATDENFDTIVFDLTSGNSENIITFTETGSYYWRVRAVDNSGLIGNWSEVFTFTLIMDTEPPIVELLYPVGNEYLSGTVIILWDATDNLTPDNDLRIKIEYRAGGPWQTLASDEDNDGAFEWNTIGYPDSTLYIIRISTEDYWGNIGSDESYTTFTVDNTNPVTTAYLNPATPNGDNDWYINNVQVTLVATDETSGIDYTKYKIDDDAWEIYVVPLTVSDDGEHTVE